MQRHKIKKCSGALVFARGAEATAAILKNIIFTRAQIVIPEFSYRGSIRWDKLMTSREKVSPGGVEFTPAVNFTLQKRFYLSLSLKGQAKIVFESLGEYLHSALTIMSLVEGW
jgi:hypothetical protein